MTIAIMGAGLSGLSCAITLEKNGIKPTIFGKRSRVGDRFVNGEANLVITFPNYPNNIKLNVNSVWDNFMIQPAMI